jgi:hypothetical protein
VETEENRMNARWSNVLPSSAFAGGDLRPHTHISRYTIIAGDMFDRQDGTREPRENSPILLDEVLASEEYEREAYWILL